jgi:hypothetical protein
VDYQRRANEPEDLEPIARQSRFVINDEGYFYRTRECDLIGPFPTESEALFDLNVFVKVTEIESTLSFE